MPFFCLNNNVQRNPVTPNSEGYIPVLFSGFNEQLNKSTCNPSSIKTRKFNACEKVDFYLCSSNGLLFPQPRQNCFAQDSTVASKRLNGIQFSFVSNVKRKKGHSKAFIDPNLNPVCLTRKLLIHMKAKKASRPQ